MTIPTVTFYLLEHRILHDQWCEGCQFDAAVSVIVTCVTESGASTATKTACPRCGAGLGTPRHDLDDVIEEFGIDE